MTAKAPLRVAAVQLATGTDVDENLDTCLRLVARAAAAGARLVVLPEFCNHMSWYDDRAHAVAVACTLDGPFVAALADAARRHEVFLKSNVTVHRGDGVITATNLLHDPAGELCGVADKLVLMGGERLHMQEADCLGDVVDTPVGRLGLYSCMDGVIFEPPRLLAVRGAQVLLNSLNSFALDEASLHIPVRAAENRVWVVAANKVGPLIPDAHIDAVSAQLGVPAAMLRGAGESQVVSPDGTVVAIGPRDGEAVVLADIDVEAADDKRRPTGTDVLAARRPEVYAPLLAPGDGRAPAPGAAMVEVAVVQPATAGAGSIDDVARDVAAAVADGARLVVLPELFWSADSRVEDLAEAVALSRRAVDALAAACGGADVVLSVVADDHVHEAVVVTRDGVVHRQRPLHASMRHPWSDGLADGVGVVERPWGRLAVLVGEDTVFPESFRLAVLGGAEVVACATTIVEPWEASVGLVERAAENRVNVVAASRPGAAGASVIVSVDDDFTLWTQWSTPFAGEINHPKAVRATSEPGVTRAVVQPASAANKQISRGTDLVAGRPWRLAGPLAAPAPAPV